MMNEKDEVLLETLKVMKDLHGKGINLYKEINYTARYLLGANGVPLEDIAKEKSKKNTTGTGKRAEKQIAAELFLDKLGFNKENQNLRDVRISEDGTFVKITVDN